MAMDGRCTLYAIQLWAVQKQENLKKKTERGKGRGVRGEEGEKIDQYAKNRGLTC